MFRLHIFVLVHGTFSRGEDWINEGSLLRQELQRAFPGAEFEQVPWDSRMLKSNSFAARSSGAQAVVAKIRELSQRTAARIVVIGHSHGGNIALKAAIDMEPAHLVPVVTLATPFITCSPVPDGAKDLKGKAVTRVAWRYFVLGVVLFAFVTVLPQVPEYSFLLVLPLGILAVLAIRDRGAASIRQAGRATTEFVSEHIDWSFRERRGKTLILVSTGDEASGFINWFAYVNRVFTGLASAIQRRQRLGKPMAWMICLQIVRFCRAIALPLAWLTFGYDRRIAALDVHSLAHFSIGDTPLGTYSVTRVTTRAVDGLLSAHSIYDNLAAIRKIIEFVESLAD